MMVIEEIFVPAKPEVCVWLKMYWQSLELIVV